MIVGRVFTRDAVFFTHCMYIRPHKYLRFNSTQSEGKAWQLVAQKEWDRGMWWDVAADKEPSRES